MGRYPFGVELFHLLLHAGLSRRFLKYSNRNDTPGSQCLRPVDDLEGRTLPVICRPSSKIGAPTPVGKVRPVFTVVPGADDADDARRPAASSLIDEIVREGARRMLAEALQAEVDAYIAQFTDERDERGRRLVVRNGTHQPREVLTTAGAVEVVAPRVNDRRVDPDTGQRGPVLFGDLAAVVPQDPEDHRSAAAAVPARTLDGRLRARAGAVPRLDGRAVRRR